MPGNHIPDDWSGGFCTMTFTVPDSPQFRAHVKGAFLWLADPVDWDPDTAKTGLPPVSDAVDVDILDGNDDAHERQDGGGFNRTNASVQIDDGFTPGARHNGGFRFDGVDVPNSATITAADIEIVCVSGSRDDPDVQIHAEDIDNSLDFLVNADVTSRVRTAAFSVWDAIGIGTSPVSSPDISSAVQEVVDRPGWVSGNALTILMIARGLYDRDFRVESYDGSPALSANLHIEYEVPSTDTSAEWAAEKYLDALNSLITVC